MARGPQWVKNLVFEPNFVLTGKKEVSGAKTVVWRISNLTNGVEKKEKYS